MIFKIGQFRKAKNDVIAYVRRNGITSLGFYCACTCVPLAAAYSFVKEDMEEHREESERKLKVLSEFYGYEEIIE